MRWRSTQDTKNRLVSHRSGKKNQRSHHWNGPIGPAILEMAVFAKDGIEKQNLYRDEAPITKPTH